MALVRTRPQRHQATLTVLRAADDGDGVALHQVAHLKADEVRSTHPRHPEHGDHRLIPDRSHADRETERAHQLLVLGSGDDLATDRPRRVWVVQAIEEIGLLVFLGHPCRVRLHRSNGDLHRLDRDRFPRADVGSCPPLIDVLLRVGQREIRRKVVPSSHQSAQLTEVLGEGLWGPGLRVPPPREVVEVARIGRKDSRHGSSLEEVSWVVCLIPVSSRSAVSLAAQGFRGAEGN
jgi:hypothetical protein